MQHPILARRGRLGIYLLGWLPLLPLVAGLLALQGEAPWGEAFAVSLPLLVLYAYLGLAAWYLCEAMPFGIAHPLELLTLNLLAALLSAGVWVLLGQGWAFALSRTGVWPLAGEHYARAMPALFGAAVPLYVAAVVLHYLLFAVETSRAADDRALAARILAREAELRALKAQLDPHFLFNCLNAIAALTTTSPDGARKMAILLAEFLRRSLALGGRQTIALGEELALVASYLAIERVRFGDRLGCAEAVDTASRECRVPPLLLQPLVENAVRHGVAQLLEGGEIRLEVRRQAGELTLLVENPIDPEPAPGFPPAPREGGGVGLRNVAERLANRYGPAGRLTVTSAGGRFRAEIVLPAESLAGRLDAE